MECYRWIPPPSWCRFVPEIAEREFCAMRSSRWSTGNATGPPISADPHLSHGRAEFAHGVLGRPGVYLRIEYHGLALFVRGRAVYEKPSGSDLGLFQRRIR